mmetsp:Transcript_20319/g.35067  ORF Transcript_20319/g.35067 Transcript_20319/m.35067 type:complete len:222 (+) Transcript_20319:1569-2234(+)
MATECNRSYLSAEAISAVSTNSDTSLTKRFVCSLARSANGRSRTLTFSSNTTVGPLASRMLFTAPRLVVKFRHPSVSCSSCVPALESPDCSLTAFSDSKLRCSASRAKEASIESKSWSPHSSHTLMICLLDSSPNNCAPACLSLNSDLPTALIPVSTMATSDFLIFSVLAVCLLASSSLPYTYFTLVYFTTVTNPSTAPQRTCHVKESSLPCSTKYGISSS